MRKTQIYLDTSVINFLFADDAPEKKAITELFFETQVRQGTYDVFASVVVVAEIQRTQDLALKKRLLGVLTEYEIEALETEPILNEAEELAFAYLAAGIVPEKNFNDALHVAITTIHELDVLLSWNFRHLANINKEARFMEVNRSKGYLKPFKITTPYEVSA